MHSLKRIMPVLLVMAVIFYFSHQPGDRLNLPDLPYFDKFCHFTIYALLAGAALYAAWPYRQKFHPAVFYSCLLLFAGLYGISDEFHQSFIAFRTPSAWDVVADCMGGLTAILLSLACKLPAPGSRRGNKRRSAHPHSD
jgi:VanZ family protein